VQRRRRQPELLADVRDDRFGERRGIRHEDALDARPDEQQGQAQPVLVSARRLYQDQVIGRQGEEAA
jgi:hypothetical protein